MSLSTTFMNFTTGVLEADKKNTKERMIRIPAIDHWGYPRQPMLKMRNYA